MKKFGLFFAACVIALVLAACGDEGGGSTADDNGNNGNGAEDNGEVATETGHSQGVHDDRIYIGNSAATSGDFAGVGVPFVAGIDAYLEMVNADGGIHGREIVRMHYDDGFDPATGMAMLERLVEDDEVFAIVGHFGTPVIAATYQSLVEIGIPTVYFAAGIGVVYQEDARETGGLNTFPVQPVFPMEGRIFAAWAAGEFGASTIGVIYTSDDAGQDMINGIRQEAEVIGGLEIVAESVEPRSEDVTAQVMNVLAANPDVVIIASIQGTVLQIARELAAQGSTIPAITSYVNSDATISAQLAGDIEGHFDLFGSSWVAQIDEDMVDYQYWVAQVQDEDLSLNSFAMTGWIAAHFFVEGLRRTPEDAINWSNYIAAMEQTPIQNPFGSAIDFSEGNRVGTQQLALLRMDAAYPAGWAPHLDFMGMDEILAD